VEARKVLISFPENADVSTAVRHGNASDIACAATFGLSTNHNAGTYDNENAYDHSRKIEVLKDSKAFMFMVSAALVGLQIGMG
jgi:hypothetical protein